MADELRQEGLIDVDVGMTTFHHPNRPTPSVDQYWVGITETGKTALAEIESAE